MARAEPVPAPRASQPLERHGAERCRRIGSVVRGHVRVSDTVRLGGFDGDDVDFFRIDVPAGKTQIMVKIANKSTAAEGQL